MHDVARLRDAGVGSSLKAPGHPTISVVVPTRNERGDLQACLTSIEVSEKGLLLEVLVVDDGAREPVALPSRGSGYDVQVLRNQERLGAAASRNRAADAAKGEVLAFIDDDARISTGWFATVARELTPSRAAITGPVVAFDSGLIATARQARYDARYAGLEHSVPVNFLAGGNSAVWKVAFLKAGGFPDVPTMSDSGLVRRLEAMGGQCHFIPELTIRHRNSKGAAQAVVQAWLAGRWTVKNGGAIRLVVAPSADLAPKLVNGALLLTHVAGAAWEHVQRRGRAFALALTGRGKTRQRHDLEDG